MPGALPRGSSVAAELALSRSDSPRPQDDRIGVAPTATGPAASGPIRSCRVCRRRLPKAQLTRWVRQKGGLVRDSAQQLPGRGSYSCSDACAVRLPDSMKRIKR
jgi:hypothetical protein